MSAHAHIKCRCPSCQVKYKLPANACGRKVRCTKCKQAFRVPVPAAGSPHDTDSAPTEDDILRWLMDDSELQERPNRPRVIRGDDLAKKRPAAETHAAIPKNEPEPAPEPKPPKPGRSESPITPPSKEPRVELRISPTYEAQIRKTG